MKLKVAFLNCRSHGDCTVITFKENGKDACIVVDGGKGTKGAGALFDYLHSKNISAIDLMVGTHIDSDHIDGLKHFAKNELKKKNQGKDYIEIKEFWGPTPSREHVPDIEPTSLASSAEKGKFSWRRFVIQSVKQNDDLFEALQKLDVPILHPSLLEPPANPFSNVALELLGPDMQISADLIKKKALGLTTRASDKELKEKGKRIKTIEDLKHALRINYEEMAIEAKRNANNQSIVFRLKPATGKASAKKWSFLFTGDAEEEAWEEMLANSAVKSHLRARVLKIPHHGSGANGITDKGAQKVKPEYSINMVGQEHGLPDKEPLELLQGLGSKLLCTQRNHSSSHKSACYRVPKSDCPAKGKPKTITFTVDTTTGNCKITPAGRACDHDW
ncbi:MAG: hypothetical protein JSV16_07390 [Candidatus Hydrogenedentota bacterium]|nr:MAG: hypothetical protein JSV16_07390 [Candidatus Hydrogenedentota bacterium]